jgi:hypothetical protein
MARSTRPKVFCLFVEDVHCLGSGFSEIMGGRNDRGLLLVALHAERIVTTVFYEEVLFIFRIVWFVTGSAHKFSSGAQQYRISVSPRTRDVCCGSRENVNGVGGAIEGRIF